VNERAVKGSPTHAGGIIAWQGWELRVPESWNPVKLEGDWNAGHALLVDLHRPRLGLRWRQVSGKKFDADAVVKKAMRDEVGQLAADEAKPFAMPDGDWQASLLYTEPEPPGRDVWTGFSPTSGRLLQIVHHARRRERILSEMVLPTVRDCVDAQATRWSVFELSCVVPANMKLADQKLMAGDLSLTFKGKRKRLTVRQVAVAELALKRMSLEKWLASQQRIDQKHYRPCRKPRELKVEASDRELRGLADRSLRRRRFFWMRELPGELTTLALHDAVRDRLIIVEGSDEKVAAEAAASAGWAKDVEK
jgi:hypothetical protein